MKFTDRLTHAWNAFTKEEETPFYRAPDAMAPVSYSMSAMKTRFGISGDKSIVDAIYTKLSLDLATITVRHSIVDENERYLNEVDSGINSCLKFEANLDQSPQDFKQDIALTMFHDGVAAITPVETTLDPNETMSYDIKSVRVGKVSEWYPQQVKVNLYNERNGKRQDVLIAKRNVAIVTNPLYDVMNKPNSTLQRLIRKLSLMDSVDEMTSSGKLDVIIQLPFAVKSEGRMALAERRRGELERQLRDSTYGVAYMDGTEKITQLNRPAENNLLKQVEVLTAQLYTQLGLTPEIMNGTASEEVMVNYRARTLVPLMNAITQEMTRKFMSKTALTKGHRITYYQNPFELVPVGSIAEIADKFSRNEIMTANEVRSVIGMKPSSDPNADKLQNSNMPQPSDPAVQSDDSSTETEASDDELNGAFDEVEGLVDGLLSDLGG